MSERLEIKEWNPDVCAQIQPQPEETVEPQSNRGLNSNPEVKAIDPLFNHNWNHTTKITNIPWGGEAEFSQENETKPTVRREQPQAK